MASIALICEGVSEIKILTYIINRYLGDDVVVNPIQPSLKLSHGQEKQDDGGGWSQVLSHCSDDVINNIMVPRIRDTIPKSQQRFASQNVSIILCIIIA